MLPQFPVAILFALVLIKSCIAETNPDVQLTTPQLIEKYGYPVEVHPVTTEDGYILEMHRIPYSPKSPAAANKPVVFLQHGLFCSSADWIVLGPEKSLGYLLADAGYDVWMGNARGNTYSKNHATLSTKSFKFWDFSWHEMGIYDLPAEIDYVLETTGHSNLYYVGHSMGTTMFFVMASKRPEYNDKIKHMTGLGPIGYMKRTSNKLVTAASSLPGVKTSLRLLEYAGLGELLPSTPLSRKLIDTACSDGSLPQSVCSNLVFIIFGYDPPQMNDTVLPVLLAHTPAGASTKTALHYAQEFSSLSHDFREFDYFMFNLAHYKSLTPPSYNLNAITAPVTLMYGNNDPFADEIDVRNLYINLPNTKGIVEVPFDGFNHIDFVWAKDVKPLVNEPTLKIIQSN